MRKFLVASLTAMAVIGLAATGAWADDDDGDGEVTTVTAYRYVAKYVCGRFDSADGVLRGGDYRTSFNFLNLNDVRVTGTLELITSNGFDIGAVVNPNPADNSLDAGAAGEVNCPDLGAQNPRWSKGFGVAIACKEKLYVTAVYSSGAVNSLNFQVKVIEAKKIKVPATDCEF